MSDNYSGGAAAGGSGRGEGQTTIVGAKAGLSPEERQKLCDLMCKCGRIGVAIATKKGSRILRQKCIAERLNFANATSRVMNDGKPTEYMPEVPYDMRPIPPDPPVPIMEDDDPTTPVGRLLDWIKEKWPGKLGGYIKGKKAGLEQIRRPDVVVVNDPSLPPVQSNIKAVVEMKFDDDFGAGQEMAYKRIAGSKDKYVALKRADCPCDDEKRKGQPARSAQTQSDTDDLFDESAGGTHATGPFGFPPLSPVGPGPTSPGAAFP
ncbi:TPA: nuclease [Burkholderia cenocepacia]